MHISARLFVLGFAGLLLAGLAAGCSSGGDDSGSITTLAAATERGPLAVGVTTVSLVDTSRPTAPNGDFAGSDERRFEVEVWYPAEGDAAAEELRDAPVDDADAPYPLIVFAHGLGSFRRQSAYYTQHLASHGYVVVSPDFPASSAGAPGGPRLGAVVEQPGDVSFLSDSFVGFSGEEGHLLQGAVDEELTGVTGHSLGGLTSLLSVYGPGRDDRIDAALPIAAPACFLGKGVAGDAEVPIMVLGGSLDRIVRLPSMRHGYDVANAPKYYVELAGAEHVRFAAVDVTDRQLGSIEGVLGPDVVQDAVRISDRAGGGNAADCTMAGELPDDELLTADRQRELLLTFATPFFDAYLRDHDASREFLERELPSQVAEARFEMQLGDDD